MSDLLIGNTMNEITLDGVILYGAKASWKSGPHVSSAVSVSGFRTFLEAKAAVIELAKRSGWHAPKP